jgi:transcriptional regulator with XRE-family HTH domain
MKPRAKNARVRRLPVRQNLNRVRVLRGLRHKDVYLALGLESNNYFQRVSRAETGNATISFLMEIAAVLKIEVAELLRPYSGNAVAERTVVYRVQKRATKKN